MSEENSASALIKQLNLAPHPEGGWYRETWRAPPVVPDPNDGTENARHNDARSAGTAILFLLKAGECSHWHKVDAQEIWLWHSGDPIDLQVAPSDHGPIQTILLGGDVAGGQALQGVVPHEAWQSARTQPSSYSEFGYSLVSCVVVPGFEFAGFTLAKPGWKPGCGSP